MKIWKTGKVQQALFCLFGNSGALQNVKRSYKGRNTLNSYAAPIDSSIHENVSYLVDLATWLDCWAATSKHDNKGFLTQDTYIAFRHTLKTLVKLIPYLLDVHQFKYVLVGKFQTDNLESRFGQYRQMSGGNRLVSIQEITESERKLKIQSLLKLNMSSGVVSVKEYLAEFSDDFGFTTNACETEDQFIANFPIDKIEFNEVELPVLLYVAGYAAKKISSKLQCSGCKELLTDEEGKIMSISIDKDIRIYFDHLNRGGLTYPSSLVLYAFQATHSIFNVCICGEYEKAFLKLKNPKSTLLKLTVHFWEICHLVNFPDKCMLCLKESTPTFLLCVNVLVNILLNNYSKAKSDNVKYSAVIAKRVAKF